jgi:hypothetical protein
MRTAALLAATARSPSVGTLAAMADSPRSPVSRRDVLKGASGSGLLAAAGPFLLRTSPAGQQRSAASSDGVPEQVHLTWGANPATSVVVSWASAGRAARRPGRITR